jgi:all-trans-retinol 13,14-reductase
MSDSYDVVVIGSGLGGLTAGALAARAGKRVLLLERHDRFGGAATVFGREDLTVEVGLHELDGLDPGDIKSGLFDKLGLRKHLDFVCVPQLYAVHSCLLGEEPFVMPDGLEEARRAMEERFPGHGAGLRRWFDTLDGIRRRLRVLTDNQRSLPWWLLNGPVFPLRFWPILAHERTTVGGFLDRLFGEDEAVKVALCANYQYYAASVRELSLLFFAAGQGSYHRGGWYVHGGSQALSDLLASQIREAGGETLTRRPAQRILVEGGRVAGVVHCDRKGRDSREAGAPVVFGNAAPHVLATMLDDEHRQSFEAPWKDLAVSTSLWSAYLAFDEDPTKLGMEHYSTFCFPDQVVALASADTSRLMASSPSGPMPVYAAVNYSRIRSGLQRGAKHLVVLCGADRLDNWASLGREEYQGRKRAWLKALTADLLDRFPGLRGHQVYGELATARSVQRYLRTPGGAVYGFAQRPDQAGLRRPSPRTAIEGLLLASAFTQPGGGFTGAMLAGQNAAELAELAPRASRLPSPAAAWRGR